MEFLYRAKAYSISKLSNKARNSVNVAMVLRE